MEKRPLILVSNDDGIEAIGVHELVDCLLKFGDVVCVCPDGPRSGQSMAISVNTPLRIERLDDWHGAEMYKVNGTPVDCIKISMHTILGRRPDLVVSGINHGSNAAINVVYSGTMGAAFEGCACGVPSIGFSLTTHNPKADFSGCLPFVDKIVGSVLKNGLPEGVCLNVNIPASNPAPTEMRITKACKGRPHIVNKTGIMYYYPSVRKVMSQESVLSRAVATTDTMPCDRHHSSVSSLSGSSFLNLPVSQ